MPRTNIYRWQVPGNANPFDTTLEDWNNPNKFVSKRSIGILNFLKNYNGSVDKKYFCNKIKNYLYQNYNNEINNSCVTDFYRPLEFIGLINRFGNRRNSTLTLSLDGKSFLNEFDIGNYERARQFLILQMLKTKYPNTASQDIQLNLFPFRIIFKLLIDKQNIDKNYFETKIPYIKNMDDLNNLDNINGEIYKKWTSWILSYLIKFNILQEQNNQISISNEYFDYIKSFVDNMTYEDCFFNDTLNNEVILTNSIRKQPRIRNNNLINEVLIDNNYQCFFDKKHITFTTYEKENFVEGHHIIPISLQDSFPNKQLDVKENIIPLCPNCHRKIHFATNETKELLLNELIKNTKISEIFNVLIQDLKQIYFSCKIDNAYNKCNKKT